MSNARNLANLLGTGTQVTTADIADGVFQANRNLIINGAMNVAQRGTSFSYSDSQSGYSLDRYSSAAFVSGGTLAVSQQTMPLTDDLDAEFFLRATTTGSVAAGSATIYTEQKVENLKRFHNKVVTLSFYVKASSALTFQIRRHKYYGSGGSSEEYSSLSDVPVTTSWTKHTVTFEAEDLSTKTFGSSSYFGIMFYWSTGQGSNQLNDASIDVTLVQLEAGDTATPFEHRSHGDELARCQRYYVQQRVDIQTPAGGSMIVPIYFPTTMRAAPSSPVTNISAGSGNIGTVGVAGLHVKGAYFQVTSSANSNYILGRIDAYIAEL